jgi:hypothetical protein
MLHQVLFVGLGSEISLADMVYITLDGVSDAILADFDFSALMERCICIMGVGSSLIVPFS